MKDEQEWLLLGKRLGFGAYRDVYDCRLNPEYVIKVARDDERGRQANLLEEKIWIEVSHTPVAKWFADVEWISEAGKYLVQKKVEMLPKSKYPEKIPHFFTDTKYDNFGWLEGKGFVCIDFGSFNMFRGISSKMVKANWWG